jgi:hypothetical protein
MGNLTRLAPFAANTFYIIIKKCMYISIYVPM